MNICATSSISDTIGWALQICFAIGALAIVAADWHKSRVNQQSTEKP